MYFICLPLDAFFYYTWIHSTAPVRDFRTASKWGGFLKQLYVHTRKTVRHGLAFISWFRCSSMSGTAESIRDFETERSRRHTSASTKVIAHSHEPSFRCYSTDLDCWRSPSLRPISPDMLVYANQALHFSFPRFKGSWRHAGKLPIQLCVHTRTR